MYYDQYGSQILAELESQSEVLDAMALNLDKINNIIDLLTVLVVVGFGVMLSYILLKWVKK